MTSAQRATSAGSPTSTPAACAFAREWVLENQANRAGFLAMRKRDADHQIEEVGRRLRAMMSWIKPPRE